MVQTTEKKMLVFFNWSLSGMPYL